MIGNWANPQTNKYHLVLSTKDAAFLTVGYLLSGLPSLDNPGQRLRQHALPWKQSKARTMDQTDSSDPAQKNLKLPDHVIFTCY
jgi:hypothetical protein